MLFFEVVIILNCLGPFKMDIEYVDKYDKDGNHLNFVRFRGHVFVNMFPKDVQTRLDQIQEIEIRDDDIILVEFMKSGMY